MHSNSAAARRRSRNGERLAGATINTDESSQVNAGFAWLRLPVSLPPPSVRKLLMKAAEGQDRAEHAPGPSPVNPVLGLGYQPNPPGVYPSAESPVSRWLRASAVKDGSIPCPSYSNSPGSDGQKL